MNITIKQRGIMPLPTSFDRFDNASALLNNIFNSRGCTDNKDIVLELKHLIPPDSLTDIDKAAQRICQAIIAQESILIVGDFDADGATSIALMVRVLKAFGASNVAYIVPNRFEDGYGLSPSVLKRVTEKPDLLITVDNGIASIEGVDYANSLGICVIITDHHLPADQKPNAYAIVNPNQHGDLFPSKNLAGVGVAFYLLIATLKHLKIEQINHENNKNDINNNINNNINNISHINTKIKMANYLDLVALGTVADVVKLDRNNRILVHHGLKRIRQGCCVEGIKSLARVSAKNIATISTSDIGFALAPRLNAVGRLDDMSFGIECLLTDDPNNAYMRAEALDELNKERRNIEQSMVADAQKILTQIMPDMTAQNVEQNAGIVVYDPSFHQGVIGIVASRIKDKFTRPTVIFTEDGDYLKGSGRSITGLHLRDALDWVDKRYPNIIIKFGGHAMAAGLTLDKSKLDLFKKGFNAAINAAIDVHNLKNEVLSDGELSSLELSLPTFEIIRNAAPWGQGFPEPLFDNVFEVIDYRVLKETHLKLRLKLKNNQETNQQNNQKNNQIIDAIAFFKAKDYLVNPTAFIHCAYKLDCNEWQDKVNLQLLIECYNCIS